MTRNIFIWTFLCSIFATGLLFIFNMGMFNACYLPNPELIHLSFLTDDPTLGCIAYSFIYSILLLYLTPLLVTMAILAIYVLIFDKAMPYTNFFVWFFWLVILYYLSFQFNQFVS